MGFEYIGPFPDPDRQPPSNANQESATQGPQGAQAETAQNSYPQPEQQMFPGGEPIYREHVSGQLRPPYIPPPGPPPVWSLTPPAPPSGQPYGYNGQNGFAPPPAAYSPGPPQSYPHYGAGYQPSVPGYYPGPYPPWAPPRPKRNTYQLVISIIAFICACLISLAGIITGLILLLISVVSTDRLGPQQLFGGQVLFVVFTIAGLVGGGFSLYHSGRALFFRKASAPFKLPWFWIFFILYLAVLIMAAALRGNGLALANVPGTIFLISLAGILPALTFLALGARRLRSPRKDDWPTTWRRFTLSLVCGTTLSIALALILEALLSLVVVGLNALNLNDPNMPIPRDAQGIITVLIVVSVVAPLVEEAVKPLGVVALIGRVRGAAEAFLLGMAGGIGFDLIETSGYISQGYKDWLDVAIQRSTAGLLHGLGAAMVALGIYYLTHRDSVNRRVLIGIGCILYAILQHAIWNGSFLLQLLPGPLGSYLANGTVTLGPVSFQAFMLVYLFESLLMLIFFIFVTGKLRGKSSEPSLQQPVPQMAMQAQRPAEARL